MDELKPARARPGGGLGVDSDSNDARRPGSETDKTAAKTVASPEITIAHLPISDPLAPTADFKSDDSLAGISINADSSNSAPMPKSFGRYRVDGVLGRGGFGAVYRAWDDQLQRAVAIKVTYREKLDPALREMFLTEARAVAGLDHASIVPVYDVGQTDSGDYFVVSKLIDGSDLAARLQTDRFTHEQTVDIIRSVALALHHAHSRGLVHRDVKPGNILIDAKGNAFLTDFGLALSENQLGRGAPLVGTLLYMSPEQARREGNRVDGRSDVYSLGVVLYQLLTDRTPFRSPEALELLDLIASTDVRPPRQIDDTIPPQVEQVCLKALSRNTLQRYSTAKDFADALTAALHRIQPVRPSSVSGDGAVNNLLHRLWEDLAPELQDAFALAYNHARREKKDRISTQTFFAALARLEPGRLPELFELLPQGSLPEPVAPDVPVQHHVLDEAPKLSSCVENALLQLRSVNTPGHKLGAEDMFVNIAKFGKGPSVVRLRTYGVTPKVVDNLVSQLGWNVLGR